MAAEAGVPVPARSEEEVGERETLVTRTHRSHLTGDRIA